tara:strand:+ start:168 stop:848 length:681 start_codon:yes stop_codon:yes gene_type:complete
VKNNNKKKFRAVLFDLDGTLIDTAHDMVAVLQFMQKDFGIEPSSFESARIYVSHGAVGLLNHGFPKLKIDYGDILHMEYLNRYSKMICVKSKIYEHLDSLLVELDSQKLPWGIVTNKPEHLTFPLLTQLNLLSKSSCVICGDTLPVRKPYPDPILLGCKIIGVNPKSTIYIGDAERDIEAGRASGCRTIAASYGYINEKENIQDWNADIIAKNTKELTQIVLNLIM